MAIRTPDATSLTNRRTNNLQYFGEAFPDTWVRNPSWPALPSITSSDQKIVGLYAVFPGDAAGLANYFTFRASGAYTIDFGDGTTTNYATNTQANYEYDYDSTALNGSNAPVTFQDTGDTVTRNNHGYSNGMIVRFYNIVSTTGISPETDYYVINAATNTFQISNTIGGAAIALTTDGSATLLPYKIAVVTITPQAGQNLTASSFSLIHSSLTTVVQTSAWLDVAISMPNSTTTGLTFGTSTINATHPRMVERVQVLNIGSLITTQSFFYNCHSLRSVIISANTTNITIADNMFFNCYSLQTVPLFNTANVTTVQSMFANCYSLQTVPLFDTAKVTTLNSMFNTCYSLRTVPLLNTISATSHNSMFSNCRMLRSVPLFNTSNSLNTAVMFGGCISLESVPLFDTAKVTSMGSMFTGCSSLLSVPLFNTALVTTFSTMFSGCYKLVRVPLFNTASATDMSSMFGTCFALRSVPLFNTASVTNMQSMFSSCHSLQEVPLFNTASVTNMQSMFNGSSSLRTVPQFNTALVTNMNNMFSGCVALQYVPLFNTANVTNMVSTFSTCSSLKSIPLLNTSKVTSMSSLFNGSINIQTVPLLVTGNVTSMSSMFFNCYSLRSIPAMNVSSVSTGNFATIFSGAGSIQRIEAKNFNFTFSVANLSLSANALNEIYTNLPIVTAQTITVSGNPGVAGDDPTIATGKGWTVTG